MPYSRAFSSLGCPDATLDAVVALATRHRVPGIELRSLEGTVELPALFSRRFGSPEALGRHLRHAAVAVRALDTGFRLIDAAVGDREKLLEFVPWAEAAGIPWLRVFDGGKTADAGELARAAENLAWWHELRCDRGCKVDLMVETHDSLLDAGTIRRFVAAVPRAALLWDSHHTWRKGGADPAEIWAAIRPHVVHVHVKDSISRPSANHPFTYVLPGAGEFPMTALRAALADGFDGPISLEWEKLWHPYLPPLEAALAAAEKNAWW